MVDRAEAMQALRRLVHDSPALQAHLFALDDADAFVVAVRQLADSLGFDMPEEELRGAMNAGQRAWIERRLP